MVNAIADVQIIDDPAEIKKADSPKGKAFLRIKLDDGTVVDMTLTLAEMIGGVGKGAQLRFGYVAQTKGH